MSNSNKKSNLWILFSIIIFLNGMGFVYIGSKSSNKKWIKEGIIYEILWIIVFLLAGIKAPSSIGVPFVAIAFIGMIVSLVRSIMVKSEYKKLNNCKTLENKNKTIIGAILCLIPLLNGLPFIYLGIKNNDGRFFIGGIVCEILWVSIVVIPELAGIAMSSLLVSLILLIKISYEKSDKTNVFVANTPKTTPKKETVVPADSNYYKDYEMELDDLKQTYDKKESRIKKYVDDKFKTSQITYSRFIDILNNSHTNFYKQYEMAVNLINLSTHRDEKIEERLHKKIDILKKINDKMEDLELELIVNENNEKKTDEDFNELMDSMGDLIDSVKNYDQ